MGWFKLGIVLTGSRVFCDYCRCSLNESNVYSYDPLIRVWIRYDELAGSSCRDCHVAFGQWINTRRDKK